MIFPCDILWSIMMSEISKHWTCPQCDADIDASTSEDLFINCFIWGLSSRIWRLHFNMKANINIKVTIKHRSQRWKLALKVHQSSRTVSTQTAHTDVRYNMNRKFILNNNVLKVQQIIWWLHTFAWKTKSLHQACNSCLSVSQWQDQDSLSDLF